MKSKKLFTLIILLIMFLISSCSHKGQDPNKYYNNIKLLVLSKIPNPFCQEARLVLLKIEDSDSLWVYDIDSDTTYSSIRKGDTRIIESIEKERFFTIDYTPINNNINSNSKKEDDKEDPKENSWKPEY